MISRTTAEYWAYFYGLPVHVQKLAAAKYQLWRTDPSHSSLRFKALKDHPDLWSVRISGSYRALAHRDGEEVVWFWIGSHSDYNQMIS